MAKQITTTVSDDIDGSPDAQSVAFAFQGVTYSIDLGSKNLDKLTKALTPFIDHATRQRGGAGKAGGVADQPRLRHRSTS